MLCLCCCFFVCVFVSFVLQTCYVFCLLRCRLLVFGVPFLVFFVLFSFWCSVCVACFDQLMRYWPGLFVDLFLFRDLVISGRFLFCLLACVVFVRSCAFLYGVL